MLTVGELSPKITALELSPKYAKFAIEPLARGFGHTLGNALRRVLLSHVPGVAVTEVRMEAVLHEFTAMPGVMEDAMEVVLNIKELAIRVTPPATPPEPGHEDQEEEERTLRISAQGETEVIGADVMCPADVEILNPEIHIAHLTTPEAKLDIEFWVEIGTGYVPTEEREESRRASGIIPVDALFSPVKRAAYTVESTRLGHRTDLDRLVLELWGNGTVAPEDALKMAARLLNSYISVFLGAVEEEEVVAEVADEALEETSKWLATPIEDVDFSVRTFNCLKKEAVNTLGELVKNSEPDLLAIRNFGKRSLDEVIEKLAQFDLALAEPPSDGE